MSTTEQKLENARNEKLRAWLDKHNARFAWEHKLKKGEGTGSIECWHVGAGPYATPIYIRRYRGMHAADGSWDIFVPASGSNDIDATLAAADRALALEPQAELEALRELEAKLRAVSKRAEEKSPPRSEWLRGALLLAYFHDLLPLLDKLDKAREK